MLFDIKLRCRNKIVNVAMARFVPETNLRSIPGASSVFVRVNTDMFLEIISD